MAQTTKPLPPLATFAHHIAFGFNLATRSDLSWWEWSTSHFCEVLGTGWWQKVILIWWNKPPPTPFKKKKKKKGGGRERVEGCFIELFKLKGIKCLIISYTWLLIHTEIWVSGDGHFQLFLKSLWKLWQQVTSASHFYHKNESTQEVVIRS